MDIKKQFLELLSREDTTESDYQEYLETHTQFLPLSAFILNHGIHMNSIITKFPVGKDYITDFAYLTKSTVCWYLVLIEIEDPKKKIFKKDRDTDFTAEFNHAYSQIKSWEMFIEANSREVLDQIEKIKKPLEDNIVRYKFVLVYGRDNELNGYDMRRKMILGKCSENIRVMTYDSLVSQLDSFGSWEIDKLIVLKTKGSKDFEIKRLPDGDVNTSLFAYMKPGDLHISKNIRERLIQQGYQIEDWENGKKLHVNNKYSSIEEMKRHISEEER